jgi:hypothetical protein
MKLEESIMKTSEYHSLSKIYPRITESIRLKRDLKRLINKLKSEKSRSSKFKIKREIAITKSKLKKNNLFKRLHRENKPEAIFQRKLKTRKTKMYVSSFTKNGYTIFGQSLKKLKRSMHKNLPPSLFYLRELSATEKGLALRNWLQEKRKKNR